MISPTWMSVWALLTFLAWVVFKKILQPLSVRSRLKKQGVVFCDYPIISESLAFLKVMKEHPFNPAVVKVAVDLAK